MRRFIAIALAVFASAFVLPSAAASAEGASSAGCYEGAVGYSKSDGNEYPQGIFFTATGDCSDINIKPNAGVFVKVCFLGGPCQPSFTVAPAGRWTAVATGVRSGANFVYQFSSTAPTDGAMAF